MQRRSARLASSPRRVAARLAADEKFKRAKEARKKRSTKEEIQITQFLQQQMEPYLTDESQAAQEPQAAQASQELQAAQASQEPQAAQEEKEEQNPLAFYHDGWDMKFLEKDGIAQTHYVRDLVDRVTYHRIRVEKKMDDHDGWCSNPIDWKEHSCGIFTLYFRDLPSTAWSLPWMKSWQEDSLLHFDCRARIHYTVLEISRITYSAWPSARQEKNVPCDRCGCVSYDDF